MHEILSYLYIGNYEEAKAPDTRVSALLNVAAERDITPDRPYHKIPIIDMQPIPSHQLKEAVLWIDAHKDNNIMIFCNAGIGRSPSIVIGYLCCLLNYRFGEAVEFVARKKTYISTLPDLIETIDNVKKEISPDAS